MKLDSSFIELFKEVGKYREQLESCYSAKEGMVVSDLLIELVSQETYLDDYKNKTFTLLYDGTDYKTCIGDMIKLANFLKQNNLWCYIF